jgi:hypothetical protein
MKVRLSELKQYYNHCILNKYIKELIVAKKVDYIIVPLDMFTQEYFMLSDNHIEMLKRILNDMGYFNPIPDRGVTKDLLNELLNN